MRGTSIGSKKYLPAQLCHLAQAVPRKRGSDDEKTPRRSPNKYRPRRRRHGANRITSYVTSITNPRGEQEDEPSPSSTQSSHDPISSAQVTEDLPSRVTRSQGQAPAQMPLPPQRKILKNKIHPSKEGSDPASFQNSRLGASIDPISQILPKRVGVRLRQKRTQSPHRGQGTNHWQNRQKLQLAHSLHNVG